MQIDVRVDIKQATRDLSWMQRRVIPSATNSALNKTARQVRTTAKRDLSKITGLTQKSVNEKLTLFRSTFRTLTATVRASGRALNLIRFKAKQTRRGVKASAWGKRKLYPGTFIANKGRTVFKRATFGGQRVGRLPIEAVHGPSIPREFIKSRVQRAMRLVVATKFPRMFDRELVFRLSKLR